MKNLLSIKYFEGLNQKSIIDEKIIEKNFPTLESMRKEFLDCVEEVYSTDPESGVHIGISFTNNLANHAYLGLKTRKRNFSFMFWPVYNEVRYEFKKENFFVNQGKDPLILIPSGVAFGAGPNRAKLFFTKNPFENVEEYSQISGFLPDLSGDDSFLHLFMSRKERARRYLETKDNM